MPAIYRKSLRLKEGDEIVFNLNNNELTLIPIKTSLQKVREMIVLISKKYVIITYNIFFRYKNLKIKHIVIIAKVIKLRLEEIRLKNFNVILVVGFFQCFRERYLHIRQPI
ncbi:hypothetical protein [Candidatus Tisiphia endosymbiont of Ditula angustiorana]|uniref:hypothetical protein n=1 Tax=Candidatus Tisiphia endosymbiont of Ditula angustiorana TaxID=3066272 RepID=UPI003977CB1B